MHVFQQFHSSQQICLRVGLYIIRNLKEIFLLKQKPLPFSSFCYKSISKDNLKYWKSKALCNSRRVKLLHLLQPAFCLQSINDTALLYSSFIAFTCIPHFCMCCFSCCHFFCLACMSFLVCHECSKFSVTLGLVQLLDNVCFVLTLSGQTPWHQSDTNIVSTWVDRCQINGNSELY